MRLNDPKRSLRGISFGYPFIARPPTSQDSSAPAGVPSQSSPSVFGRILKRPNRVLDLLYGVKLMEWTTDVDPWIQRCRYVFCYGLALLAVGLCTASAYLIVVSTRGIGQE
ncbi:hypothetical protein BDZ97DRAFT_1840106 [Flammula alnicola]|nr:hypothetical protein BDZ97DRAFT_1840106 [Flammula alnicola]